MAYPDRLLNDDEGVTVDLHPHWSFLAAPTTLLVAGIIGGIATLVVTDDGGTVRPVAVWASIVVIALGAGWLAVRYSQWLTTHFVITDQRVIFRTGLATKHGIEIPLERVNTVHFRQGVMERMVGAGDLLIESGGESGQQRFTHIRQPDRVQRVIHAGMAARTARSGHGPTIDLADQIERLEQMRDRGTLTNEEFERQKRRLLDW